MDRDIYIYMYVYIYTHIYFTNLENIEENRVKPRTFADIDL